MNTEQRARELLAEEMDKAGMQVTASHVRRGSVVGGHVPAICAIVRALSQPAGPGEGQIGEFVIAMLIAAGYVTQAKVDEARKIALSHGPYEMAAPTPPATAQEDGRDAARYRWLRDQGMGFAHDEEHRGISTMRWGEWALDTAEGFANQIDAAIDAAMLTSPDSGKEG
jgi:hypothetical protein